MNHATWRQLKEHYCSQRNVIAEGSPLIRNPFYEEFASRRYNYSSSPDTHQCRLVFLKGVLENSTNQTLRRKGRFIWCGDLRYEGRNSENLRSVSFTVDKGRKRFVVAENNVLCIPSKIFVNNNRYVRTRSRTFIPFSSVFSYKNSLKIMAKTAGISTQELINTVHDATPYKPGTLVRAREGYFYPQPATGTKPDENSPHPYGIVLGPAPVDDFVGHEFYRVRFAETTYERIHPVQMEIVNEV